MINEQKLIKYCVDEKTKCQSEFVKCQKKSNEEGATLNAGANMAFGLVLDQIALLLKEETAKDLPVKDEPRDELGRTFDDWAEDEFCR